jgi:carboxymethylenebutenolidase
VPISRTVGQDRVIDEFVVCFTHDVEMPAILPGVPPTGRYVELPHVAVVGFAGSKIAYEHIYWDQASILVQIGLLDPTSLPVAGADQARKMLDKSLPSNALIERMHTLS